VITGDLSPTTVTNVGSAWAGNAWSKCQGALCSSPKKNFGLVYWATHGSPQSASEIIDTNSYVSSLDDLHPAFTVQQSCNNSDPYYSDNISSALLQNGAIASLGASRISWPDGDNNPPYKNSAGENDVVYGYMFEMITNGYSAGQALSNVRMNLNGVVAAVPLTNWWLKEEYAAQLLLFNLLSVRRSDHWVYQCRRQSECNSAWLTVSQEYQRLRRDTRDAVCRQLAKQGKSLLDRKHRHRIDDA
jgi:hypothetical protein